jgi:hypothetical protein
MRLFAEPSDRQGIFHLIGTEFFALSLCGSAVLAPPRRCGGGFDAVPAELAARVRHTHLRLAADPIECPFQAAPERWEHFARTGV